MKIFLISSTFAITRQKQLNKRKVNRRFRLEIIQI